MAYEKKPRSWSQLEQYTACPYSYYLERIEKVWSRPAAWFPMGTAVHKAAEEYERTEGVMTRARAKEVFRASYTDETNSYLAETPNPSFWHASGPYRGPEDILRRYEIGLGHVDRYIDFSEHRPEESMWIKDGELALEQYFELDLDGVTVRGYIDQVVRVDPATVRPVDVKSGNSPGKDPQLSIYKCAVEDMAPDLTVEPGEFLMTKAKTKAKPVAYTVPAKTVQGREELTDMFGELEENLKAENFEPKPGPDCRRCGVNDSCPFYK